MNATQAIIPVDQRIDIAVQNVRIIQEIVRQLRGNVLMPDHDYGVIPGTGDKPTLLLPGMEKLMRALNAEPEYIERCVIRDYDRPLFHYEYECRLVDIATAQTVPGGRGIGLCTSEESAFKWRWVSAEDIPLGLDVSTLKTRAGSKREMAFAIDKAETSGKYGKPAEYWQEFVNAIANNTARKVKIKSAKGQEYDGWEIGGIQYRVANPDIFDQLNAIMKRAKKRALGDAIKGAANVSEFFTVDLEDFTEYTPVVIELPPSNVVTVEDKPATPKASNVTDIETVRKTMGTGSVERRAPYDKPKLATDGTSALAPAPEKTEKAENGTHPTPETPATVPTPEHPTPSENVWQYDYQSLMKHADITALYPKGEHRANVLALIERNKGFEKLRDMKAAVWRVKRFHALTNGKEKLSDEDAIAAVLTEPDPIADL